MITHIKDKDVCEPLLINMKSIMHSNNMESLQ